MSRASFGVGYQVEMITTPLLAAAALAARVSRNLPRPRPSHRHGTTLRPGPNTPRWNQLAKEAARLVRRRGEKVRLARILGISRQRLHLLLKAKTTTPDAERTLLLLEWVELRRRGINLA